MPAIDTKIWLALRKRLEAWTLPPDMTILWPGEHGQLPNGFALEVTHMPNRPQRRYLGSTEPHYRQGILQVGVLMKVKDVQTQAHATETAGRLAEHFPTDLRVPYDDIVVRVQEAPAVGGSFRDEQRARWVTPLTIRYHLEG